MNNTKRPKSILVCLSVLFLILNSTLLGAQNRTISITAEDQPLSTVLKRIEKASGYSIFFNEAAFDKSRKISIKAVDKDVLKVLNEVFSGTNVQASIIENNIVLSTRPSADTSKEKNEKNTIQTGKIPVKGIILDNEGQAVIGAAVISRSDGTNGVITDIDGTFSYEATKGDILTITAMGFKSEEISVAANMPNLRITLQPDIELLDEVVVVGYGTQKRSDITGAISSVDTEKAKAIPTNSVAEMLRCSAPGIQVNVGSAAPGGSSSVLIRGRHSLSGDNAPLYIVDGVPMSSIDDVNANEISSMEVLKDASSQSIYGARAANGVILITTKRGSAGKTRVSYDGYVGVQTITRNFEFYDGDAWAAYRHEAFYNAYGYYNQEECFRGLMSESLDSRSFTDWESIMIKPAVMHSHNILVQAGNDKTKLAAGLGWFQQDGMVRNSDFKKISGRINVDQKLGKNISLGANLSYTRSWKSTADGSFNQFVTMPPLSMVRDAEGNLLEDVTEAGEGHTNPLWNISNSKNDAVTSRLVINGFLDWKITKWLSYRLNASMSQRDVDSRVYKGLKHTSGRNTNGAASVTESNNGDYLLENILNFDHNFGSDHHLDATLMQSINVITWRQLGSNATGFTNDDLYYNAIGLGTEFGKPDFQLSKRQLASFLGRVRYNYKDRYLFSVSARVDGSSVFGAKHKYGVFPSAAFAWRINKEPFMKSTQGWLSNLKLRLSWGMVGNQGISPYTTLGSTNSYYYRFGDTVGSGYLPSATLYNPDLKWETSTTTNIGIDFGFLKDRISGTIEVYDTETTDLLVSRSINQVLGYSVQTVNLGRVQNKGLEISLNTTPVAKRNFNWDLDLSLSRNINTIKKISGEVDENGKPVNDVNNRWFIGHPVNVYYDYKFDGIWQKDDDIESSAMPTSKPGAIRIADTDGSGDITVDDRVIMSKDPDWIGGISTAFSFYGVEIGATMNLSIGGTFYNPYLTTFDNGGDLTGKKNGIRRNYWTTNNPSNEAPAPNMIQAPAYITALGYQDASYFRLRTATIGYTFKQEVINRIRLQSLKLYLTATNVWYCTKVLGYGPEQSPGSYPEPRTIQFGIKASF